MTTATNTDTTAATVADRDGGTATVLKVLTGIQHALAGMAVTIIVFIFGFVTGVMLDVVGILWARPEDYPYMDAWLSGTCVVAVLAGVGVWALLRHRHACRTQHHP